MRRVLGLFICLFLVSAPLFAEVKDINVTNRHTCRIATSSSDDSFYLSRVESVVDYGLRRLGRTVRISPFLEYQHNLETDAWWRKEIGAEIGTFFFGECLYYGASFQHIWQQEENYAVEPFGETSEWESRFVITPPIKWGIFKDRLTLHLFDEYTYDFKRGQATFNEVGAVFDWKLKDWLRVPVGWRHIDRVHDFDADLMEFSILFSF